MSVAFRRDGDEEHLEPKFEMPIPAGPNLVTPRGLAQIHARVAELEALVHAALTDTVDEAVMTANRRALRYWRTQQATAQPMPAPDAHNVAFGCTVTFRMNGQDRTITLVGHDEADPASGLLSFAAPLCRAMMEAEVDEKLDFGGKSEAIEILAIEVRAD